MTWANKSVETNRRPASPFKAARRFERAPCAPPSLSAAVAHLALAVIRARMKSRDLVIICPLLALAILCLFFGYRQGWRAQKKESTEFLIRRSLRVLHEAERGDIASITNGCRMYLLGHTKAYEDLLGSSDIPDSFRASFTEARQIAREVQTNLVVFDPKTLDQ